MRTQARVALRRRWHEFGAAAILLTVASLVLSLVPPQVTVQATQQAVSVDLGVQQAPASSGDKVKHPDGIVTYEAGKWGRIEVGDRDKPDVEPHLRLSKWGSECVLSLGLPTGTSVSTHQRDSDKHTWQGQEIDACMYPLDPRTETVRTPDGRRHEFSQMKDGGFEFEVIFNEIPQSNVLELPIETRGLRYSYQGPLHPDHPTWADENGDGIADNIRPENVVGSYAVYHATRGQMHAGADADKYRTSKAFHIYRPKLIDADGQTVWADLAIDAESGLLTVTVDPKWLTEARYPVTVDPDFGYTSQGASDVQVGTAWWYGEGYSPASDGTAVSMSIWTWYYFGTYGFELGLYERTSDKVGDYVAHTEEGITPGDETPELVTVNFTSSNPSVSSATGYLMVYTAESSMMVCYDEATAHDTCDDDWTYGTWPETLDGIAQDNDCQFSIYCTYEEGAAEPSITQDPSDYSFGVVSASSTPNTTLDHFNVTNTGGSAINVTIQGEDLIGGVNWTLDDSASPGADTYGLKAGLDGGSFDIVIKKTSPYNNLVTNLGTGSSQLWGLKMYAPSSFSDGVTKEGNITLTATSA